MLFFLVISFIIGVVRHRNSEKIVALITTIEEEASPLDTLPIQKVEISMHDRTLVANYYEVNSTAPSIFICTGNNEALFEYLALQDFLFKKGYSSFVFSYSGFGNSTGTPTETSLFKDTEAAYKKYISLNPEANARYGLSHSLGGTPLLKMTPSFEPSLDKIVVHASFSSIVDWMIDKKMVEESRSFLWPHIWYNEHAAENIEIPVLYIHSKNDKTTRYYHSERLAEASGDYATLLLTEGWGHNAIYQKVNDEFYDPILDFLEQ